MKNIKEKQLLVNFAKALGQDVDPSIVKEVESYTAIQKEVHKSIRESSLKDLSEAFRSIKLEKAPQEPTTEVIIETNYPLPPSLDDLMASLSEAKEEIQDVFDKASEIEETLPEEEKTELKESLVDLASKFISEAPKNSFQQPDPLVVSSDIDAIRGKIKFLEQWLSKVSTAGPGSGEVRFRYLDDVDRSTIDNSEHVLRYNPVSKKFFFGQLTGDQGPIRSMTYDTRGYSSNVTPTAGMTSWNSQKDCLNIYQNDGTILQTGLENYILVWNDSANTLPNGSFISLNTLTSSYNEIPACQLYQANAGSFPYFTLGLLTSNLLPNTIGRATVLGEVHDLDTTGNLVNETWSVGDVLWAHPGVYGGLTKYRPTAPNVAVTVGKVVSRSATDGMILVRPTVLPHFYYGTFISTVDQRAANINYPYAIRYDYTPPTGPVSGQSGFHLASNTRIVAENVGLYNYQFSLQLSSSSASSKNIWIWPRIDGQDVPNSATKITISENQGGDVAAWNFVFSMIPDRYFELMWAVDNIDLYLDNPAPTSFCPAIPSVILTVTQVNS